MIEDYVIGTLLTHNKEDTQRIYFITDYEKYSLKRWMFKYGWRITGEREYVNNGVCGYRIIFERKEKKNANH